MILQPSVIATSAPLGALSIQTRLDVSLILIDVQKKKKMLFRHCISMIFDMTRLRDLCDNATLEHLRLGSIGLNVVSKAPCHYHHLFTLFIQAFGPICRNQRLTCHVLYNSGSHLTWQQVSLRRLVMKAHAVKVIMGRKTWTQWATNPQRNRCAPCMHLKSTR